MRKTQAKKTIEKIFRSTKKPIKLKDLFENTKKILPLTAYSTVYRVVQKLELEHKITKIDWRDRGSFYEWANLPHHHHVVCEQCDTVADINDDSLAFNEQIVSQQTGFSIVRHSIELYGICKPCQEKTL